MAGLTVIWHTDYTSELYLAVKGSCKHAAAAEATVVTHFFMFMFDISIWWDFVDSKTGIRPMARGPELRWEVPSPTEQRWGTVASRR